MAELFPLRVYESFPDQYKKFVRHMLQRDEERVEKRGATAERPEERLINSYVLLQAYLMRAVKGLGYLALTWSTVVLLGGFVTALRRNDFWCLTVISMIQAASIFDNLHGVLLPNLLKLALKFLGLHHSYETTTDSLKWCFSPLSMVKFIGQILNILVSLVVFCVLVLYQLGPLVCIALSWWRLWVHDFGDTNGDNSRENMKPALIMFYALVLLQGAFYWPWQLCDTAADEIIQSVCRRCKLCSTWGRDVVADYLLDARAKCARELIPVTSNLVTYAAALLDSELPEKFLSGARTLDTLIKQGDDVRSLLLLSKPMIQKLIDTLGWRSNTANNCEIRELAARILADLASDIYLDQFPGAKQCISSLFQTNEPYCNQLQVLDDDLPPQNNSSLALTVGTEIGPVGRIKAIFRRAHRDGKKSYIQQREGGRTSKELILQGLTILERLASNQHNCRKLYGIHGLIPKITAPLYSSTLTKDIKISGWADVVSRSLKVLHQLIRCPEEIGRRLRCDLSSHNVAMSNLESIIDPHSEAGEELQVRAMEILTELAMDSSINRSTEENVIKTQMKIFLADEGEEKPESMLRTTAGRTLAVLTTNSEINCVFLVGEFHNIIHSLIIMLDDKTNIIYRAITAEILENLCIYCHRTLREQNLVETLLSKILTEILCNGNQNIFGLENNGGIDILSAPEDDEENRLPGPSSTGISSNQENRLRSSNQRNNTMDEIVQNKLQEPLLSLTLSIYDRIIDADRFDAAVQQKAPNHGAFVVKLKAIVEENYQVMPSSLRIIKLCCQIAISMIKRKQCTDHFKHQKFIESLSEAIKIMSELEIYMLYAGTDFGVKKKARPLLLDLEKELRAMLPSDG